MWSKSKKAYSDWAMLGLQAMLSVTALSLVRRISNINSGIRICCYFIPTHAHWHCTKRHHNMILCYNNGIRFLFVQWFLYVHPHSWALAIHCRKKYLCWMPEASEKKLIQISVPFEKQNQFIHNSRLQVAFLKSCQVRLLTQLTDFLVVVCTTHETLMSLV